MILQHAKLLSRIATTALFATALDAFPASNNTQIPVLLYHLLPSGYCDYRDGLLALDSDIQKIHAQGYTIVPLFWIAQWVRGDLASSALPLKPIGISFDDGPPSDWDSPSSNYCGSGPKSGYQILYNYQNQYSLPNTSAHATTFVLASDVARSQISGGALSYRGWWTQAQTSGLMEVQNHGADHDHRDVALTDEPAYGPTIKVPINGLPYPPNTDAGNAELFTRTNTYERANLQIRVSAQIIENRGINYPDLFAYPYGNVPPYVRDTYFPNYGSEHLTYAAFALGDVRTIHTSNAYSIPRFTHMSRWKTSSQFLSDILRAPRSDLNFDGKTDWIYRDENSGTYQRLLMSGLSVISQDIAYSGPTTAWKAVADGDFEGNGRSKLVLRNSSTGDTTMVTFSDSGYKVTDTLFHQEPNQNWKVAGTLDIDGDGKADLLWWNSTTYQVWAMLMNGSSIVSQGTVHTASAGWQIVGTGSFDGGAKKNQILWRNSTSGEVYLMTVNQNGAAFEASGSTIYTESNTAWQIIGTADFNGDGKSDILWRNSSTGQVYMFLMNGPTIQSQGYVYVEQDTANWKIVALGDFDGDGFADIAYRHESAGQTWVLLMDGLTIKQGGQGSPYTQSTTSWKLLGAWEYGKARGLFP